MDMLGQGLPPRMENRRAAHFRAEGFGDAGKLLEGLGRRLEQQGVEEPLVHANEGIEPMRQGEDDGEVGNRQ